MVTKKFVMYIHSYEVPTVGFVDREGAQHACAQAQKIAFQGLALLSSILGNRYLPDEERDALTQVEEFCRAKGLEFQVVDVATVGFLEKLKLRVKGLKTPSVCCGHTMLCGVPSEESLRELLRS